MFKKGSSHSVWPMILTCFNYDPYYRFQDPNVFCVGIIPGPQKPLDMNSFFSPLIQEFQKLQKGIPGVLDGSIPSTYGKLNAEKFFQAHGYIVMVGADMPARGMIFFSYLLIDKCFNLTYRYTDMIMGLRGHNAKHYCNYCNIRGYSNGKHI